MASGKPCLQSRHVRRGVLQNELRCCCAHADSIRAQRDHGRLSRLPVHTPPKSTTHLGRHAVFLCDRPHRHQLFPEKIAGGRGRDGRARNEGGSNEIRRVPGTTLPSRTNKHENESAAASRCRDEKTTYRYTDGQARGDGWPVCCSRSKGGFAKSQSLVEQRQLNSTGWRRGTLSRGIPL